MVRNPRVFTLGSLNKCMVLTESEGVVLLHVDVVVSLHGASEEHAAEREVVVAASQLLVANGQVVQLVQSRDVPHRLQQFVKPCKKHNTVVHSPLVCNFLVKDCLRQRLRELYIKYYIYCCITYTAFKINSIFIFTVYDAENLTRRPLSTGIFSAENVTHQHGFEPTTSRLSGRHTTN